MSSLVHPFYFVESFHLWQQKWRCFITLINQLSYSEKSRCFNWCYLICKNFLLPNNEGGWLCFYFDLSLNIIREGVKTARKCHLHVMLACFCRKWRGVGKIIWTNCCWCKITQCGIKDKNHHKTQTHLTRELNME